MKTIRTLDPDRIQWDAQVSEMKDRANRLSVSKSTCYGVFYDFKTDSLLLLTAKEAAGSSWYKPIFLSKAHIIVREGRIGAVIFIGIMMVLCGFAGWMIGIGLGVRW